jgi:hypothetical protein
MNFYAKLISVTCIVSLFSGCALKEIPESACDAADRKITLRNLVENRVSNAYDACLYQMRREAVDLIS